MKLTLLQMINEGHHAIAAVLENWEFDTMEQLLEYGDETAAQARAGEREWYKDMGGDWGKASQNVGQRRGPSMDPQPGDVVQTPQGKMFQLGDMGPNGDFTSVAVDTGQKGMTFLPQYLKKRFFSKVGKDGRKMWMPRQEQQQPGGGRGDANMGRMDL